MAELSEADVQFIKDLRQAKEEGRISRRDALKVAVGLGLGGVVGGAGGASMFGTAGADASTSDSDGNVGLPGDRVDVFAEGMDAKLTTIESLEGTYPGRVRGLANGEVVASIDPSTTTTPVDDARSAIKSVADAGRIELPGFPVTEGGTLGGGAAKPLGGIEVVGPAVKKSTPTQGVSAEIHFTTDGSKGFDLAADDDHGGLTNAIVRGPGQGGTAAPALDFSGNTRGFDLDGVYFTDWSGDGITNAGGGTAFEMNWGFVQVVNVDGLPFNWPTGGAPNHADYLKLNGSGNQVFNMTGGNWQIDTMNIGGDVTGGFGVSAAMKYAVDTEAASLSIRHMNWEPATITGVNKIWTVRSSSPFALDMLKVGGPQLSHAVGLNVSPGHKRIGAIHAFTGSTEQLTGNHIDIQDTPAEACEYGGVKSECDNNTGGTLSSPTSVKCLDGWVA